MNNYIIAYIHKFIRLFPLSNHEHVEVQLQNIHTHTQHNIQNVSNDAYRFTLNETKFHMSMLMGGNVLSLFLYPSHIVIAFNCRCCRTFRILCTHNLTGYLIDMEILYQNTERERERESDGKRQRQVR